MRNKKILILIAILFLCIESVSAMEVVECGGLENVPYKPLELVGKVIKILQIAAPIVLIIMGMLDMAKAVMANDDKNMKESSKIFVKRLIYGVLLFFVVAIVRFLLEILGDKTSFDCASCVVGNDCDTTEINISEIDVNEPGVTDNNYTKSGENIAVTKVRIISKKTKIAKGKTFKISAKVNPTNATNQKLKYKSSKTSVATVSSKGKVTAKKEGTTKITVQSVSNPSKKKTFTLEVIDPLDEKREKVVNYAKKFLGNPYVYGGTSLTKGTDCSGFTMGVYKKFGYSLPRTSTSQRKAGKKVASLSKAKPGDLICYDGHVAIYMGNNKIIHASNAREGIKTTTPANYRTIVAIRRIIY